MRSHASPASFAARSVLGPSGWTRQARGELVGLAVGPGGVGLATAERSWSATVDEVARLAEEARTVGARLVEVGLPGARYPDEPQTRAFYEAHGFETVGVRMRLALPPSGQVK